MSVWKNCGLQFASNEPLKRSSGCSGCHGIKSGPSKSVSMKHLVGQRSMTVMLISRSNSPGEPHKQINDKEKNYFQSLLSGGFRGLHLSSGTLCSVLLGTAAAASLSLGGSGPGVWDRALQFRDSAWALTEENIVFLEAWRTLDRAYIDKTFNGQNWFKYRQEALKSFPMGNRQETYDAIRSMISTLDDPFTRFLEPEKLRALRSGTNGEVTGVGLELAYSDPSGSGSDPEIVVVSPVMGGPAARAGIQPGDVISAIDGNSTQGMGLYETAQKLQGSPQTVVELTVRRGSKGEQMKLSLSREKIDLNPVTWGTCSSRDPTKQQQQQTVGYIRLATFNQNSASSVKKAIEELQSEGVGSFVLDIRNNGGGLFPAGVEIARMWLPPGQVVVYICDSAGVRDIYDSDAPKSKPSYSLPPAASPATLPPLHGAATGNSSSGSSSEAFPVTDKPLAVLVNQGTASASEILAGALKDSGRAVLLGERTFGKGKIQSVFELSDGSGMAVTVARYQTPASIDIDKVGISPNKRLPPGVPMDKDGFCSCLEDPDNGLTEAYLFS